MRFGILTVDGIFPKSLRDRRPHLIGPAILPPRYEVRSSNVNELVLPCGGSLDLDGGPDLLELLLHVGRFRLGHLLLYRLWGGRHRGLRFLWPAPRRAPAPPGLRPPRAPPRPPPPGRPRLPPPPTRPTSPARASRAGPPR